MEAKQDFFTKVSDRRDIVDFVKEVEKYRCLYDTSLPEYANKVHNRRAWQAIANKSNTSVPDCRDKWRKIRISFMRSLKQQQSDKPPMRPYYLTDELHFLVPFLKVGPKSHKLNGDQHDLVDDTKKIQAKGEPMETEIVTVNKEISDSDSSYCSEGESNENVKEIKEQENRVTFNENTIRNIMKNAENSHGKLNIGKHSYLDDVEGNPRKMFLLSMLPDIESLTEQEMRMFRREVITAVDNIINRRIIRN